ncbi:MAG: hypothetical protein P8Y44_11820 [Acidobacteriota bacterium]|jgi:hypothetical protein
MNRRQILCTSVLLATVLVAGIALADECKPVNARLGQSVYSTESCMYMGIEFLYCAQTPVSGNLKGTWHYYGEEDNGLFWPEDFSDPSPYSSLLTGWALGVIETKVGSITVQDNFLANLNNLTSDSFPFVTMLHITGGTGRYDGATGWMGVIADDVRDWRGYMHGEICTP